MKFNISPSCLEEISKSSIAQVSKNSFWGGFLSDDFENPEIQTIQKLPHLTPKNLEKVFAEQEISFDTLIVLESSGGKTDLKSIKEFCSDMGIFYYCVNPLISQKVKLPKKIQEKTRKKTNLIQQSTEKNNTVTETQTSKEDPTKSTLIEIDTTQLREIFTQPQQDFQKRPQQIKMIRTILDTFQNSEHAFIEAATGTGKSLAYLLASILLVEQTGERMIISTHTKTLQSQLLDKDIPKALKMLNSNIQVGLVKGKTNYLCLRRFFDFKSHITQQTGLFIQRENIESALQKLELWLETTTSGDLDSIGGEILSIRSEINTQSALCNKRKCPFFKDCYYFKLWSHLENSRIIVVNHALLVSQMDMEYRGIDYELIPYSRYLVVDEAHHFPKTALREESFSSYHFINSLIRLTGQDTHKKGFLGHLAQLVKNMDIHLEFTEFLDKISQIEKNSLQLKTKMQNFFQILPKILSDKEYYRLTPETQEQFIKHEALWLEMQGACLLFLSSIEDCQKKMNTFAEDFKESQSILYQQIEQCKIELSEGLNLWAKIFSELMPKTALWLEEVGNDYCLYFVNLDNQEFLRTSLWERYQSIILTSATLSVNKSFEDLKAKLFFVGSAQESLLLPVFNYQKNCLFLVVNDLPLPIENTFNQKTVELIIPLIQSIKGGSLVLATSNEQMNLIAESLAKSIKRPILVQGKDSVVNLLESAKQERNAVLLGVDSFWEGIDIPGDALELVILTKIPFKPPGHPVTDVLSEMEKEIGNNPFATLTLTEATIKFKQGYGRLLRTENDKGVVVCLDHRLISKYYGKTIQNSLYTPVKIVSQKQLFNTVKQFFNQSNL